MEAERLSDWSGLHGQTDGLGPARCPLTPSPAHCRTTAPPCGACARTPWKACFSCCSSPSCLQGPWPPPSAACPEPGPSSHPGQEGREARSWVGRERPLGPLLWGSILLMDPPACFSTTPPIAPQ